jgi:hypothetical protein
MKKVAEFDCVYGRYNELVNGGYFMVYKPTFTSLGGPILYGKWQNERLFNHEG